MGTKYGDRPVIIKCDSIVTFKKAKVSRFTCQ